ncbi:MAG: lipoyl synthase [Planctomycetales bacterium 4572_13]|nr:MAG: lipoyl synthase [Planctomycetales bacterium 4572_13]
MSSKIKRRLPPWLTRRIGAGETFKHTHHTLDALGIETICTNADCPNRGDCWSRGTATVLILGNICTRNCKFCAVGHGKPLPPDVTEPDRVAQMAKEMKLKYLVITSVDRDDLDDGGAGHFRDVIARCRKVVPELEFELLVPDFRDSQDASLEILKTALPFVFGHNVETVPSLYSTARPGGDYQRSLDLLEKAKQTLPSTQTKSSLMLGLGEQDDELMGVLKDLRAIGCDRLALGQYLRPDKNSLAVEEYITPKKFDWWAQQAKALGFTWVQSSPFTRSSYHAEEK